MNTPPRTKCRRPWLRIAVGSTLLLAAVALAVGWFYVLVPLRHRTDPNWMASHSELGRWNEEQKMYRRLGTSPDLVFRPDKIHFYGGKEWFKWLLDHVNGGSSSFRVCGCTYSCLCYISNHGFDSDEEWNRWYAANKDKTHEEWLQAGFAKRGIAVTLPPSSAKTEALLSLLGRLSSDPKRTNFKLERAFEAPGYVRYNAFRWLRDMGFEPVDYLLDHEVAKLPPELIHGIREYQKLEHRFPKANAVGLLSFSQRDSADGDHFPHSAVRDGFGYGTYALIVAFGIGGFCLIRQGLRIMRLKSVPASRATRPPGTADDPPDH